MEASERMTVTLCACNAMLDWKQSNTWIAYAITI